MREAQRNKSIRPGGGGEGLVYKKLLSIESVNRKQSVGYYILSHFSVPNRRVYRTEPSHLVSYRIASYPLLNVCKLSLMGFVWIELFRNWWGVQHRQQHHSQPASQADCQAIVDYIDNNDNINNNSSSISIMNSSNCVNDRR